MKFSQPMSNLQAAHGLAEFILLMHFKRQTIRVEKECHVLACILVKAYRLALNAFFSQFIHGGFDVVHLKCQMP